MSELALYRKYRSQTFDQVVGQAHIITTLTNALANHRISHAYLFTGPRGVGKTSVARLLARATNCLSDKITPPCNSCEICQIPLASNMDIIEIDAASNRKIDEIRDLRDKINLSPARSRYKVYIIDEVHMLTTEAFNALLKTLEEPPAHAIFILATTEVHKLPETIISRTQRFNFKAINQSDVEAQLSKIAAAEGISIESAALAMIAEAGGGSFRDAISLLDQAAMSGHGQDTISATNVSSILGLGDAKAVRQLANAIAEHQPAEAIKLTDQLSSQGVQTNQLVRQLINHYRHLLLAKISGRASETEVALTESELATVINQLSRVMQSTLPEIALETTLIQLCLADSTRSTAPNSTLAVASPPTPRLSQSSPEVTKTAPPKASTGSSDLWPKALVLIKAKNNSLYALLCSCRAEINQTEVTINCRFNFHRERLQEAKNREIIEAALSKVYGQTMRVRSQLEQSQTKVDPIDPAAELVSSALEILGGEVVDE